MIAYFQFDCSNNDFASGLENFGFCKMKSQAINTAQITSTSMVQSQAHCHSQLQTGSSFPPPEVQNLKVKTLRIIDLKSDILVYLYCIPTDSDSSM